MESRSSPAAEDIFARVLDVDESERLCAVAQLCAGDVQLIAEVRALLERLPDAESYFARFPSEADDPPAGLAGRRVGAYRITGELGRGGMGVVYRAERDDGEFVRQVAVKFVGALAVGGDARRRFEREKRILGGLRHPNIAELLDAGISDEGAPYIVMELVEGVRMDEYCRTRRLSIPARIRLFQHVARAVDFIHRNLVVHRDIKPGNVLVTADGVPKLLDFGISRVLPAADDEGDRTAPEQRLMTLAYSSPEQLRGERVSTASDVYSLGLLLYELLAQRQAFVLSGALPMERLRMVLEDDPPPPGVDTDLDQVVMKAIRKTPAERYASARDLVQDLDHYLARRPVTAIPPTTLYRVRKWVRRNRVPVALGAAAAALLLAAVSGALWQAQVARREQAIAERRFDELRKLATSILFEFHDPISRLAGTTEVRRLMVTRSLEYLDSLARDARADVNLRLELASAYRRLADVQGNPNLANLGDAKGALDSYAKASALLDSVLSVDPHHLEALRQSGDLQTRIGAQLLHVGQPAASLESKRRALAYWQRLANDAPGDDSVTRGLAGANSEMATATDDYLGVEERLAYANRARAMYEELLARRPADPERMRDLARTHRYLSGMQADTGRFREHAEAAARLDGRRVEIQPGNGAAQIDLAQSLGLVATGWAKRGDYVVATGFAERSVVIRRALWDADPKDHRVRDRLAWALTQLGQYRAKQRDWQGALDCLGEAIQHAEALAGDTDFYSAWDTLAWAHLERAGVYTRLGSAGVCAEYRAAADSYRRLMSHRAAYYAMKLAAVTPKLAACGGG